MTWGMVWAQCLGRKADDPAAFIASLVKGSSCEDKPITWVCGRALLMRRVASTPPRRGILTSMIMTSGNSISAISIAEIPSAASPTTAKVENVSNNRRRASRMGSKSSTRRMPTGVVAEETAGLPRNRHYRVAKSSASFYSLATYLNVQNKTVVLQIASSIRMPFLVKRK
jgi:hypothetical protein